MRLALRCVSILILWAVSGCAVAEFAKTSVPPLTLGPAPIIMTAGTCEVTDDLAAWTQAAYFLTTDFVTRFKAAAAKPRGEVFDDVVALQDLRSNMIARPTPGCALDAQKTLAAAMDAEIRALQSYSNGDQTDLASRVPALTAQMDKAVAMQNALIELYRRRLPTPWVKPTSVGGPVGG